MNTPRRVRRPSRRTTSEGSTGGIPSIPGLPEAGVNSQINMTPMIDVMMALLIIFMVVTPVITAYNAQLPRASVVSPETEEDVVELGIDAQGRFWVDQDLIAPPALVSYLSRLYASRPGDHLLYLRADRSVPYEFVLDAVDAARAAGVRRIGAITEPVAVEGAGGAEGDGGQDSLQAVAGGEF